MALDLILARQSGVISRAQALRCGLTGAAVDHQLRMRRWRPLHPRVYLAPGHGYDDEARARAAVLWAGEGAVLSGRAAAWWHGLLADAPVTLGVTAPVRRHPRPGIAVRCRTLAAQDRARVRGLPVTAAGLTALEAAVELGPPEAAALLDHALQRRVDWVDVLAAHDRNPGSAAVSGVLAATVARSAVAAEAVLVRLLRAAGTSGWHQVPAPAGEAAVVFPATCVAVQAVGWAGCPGRAPGVRPGWTSLRYGWPELVGRPRAVLTGIAAAVTNRDLHHGKRPDRPVDRDIQVRLSSLRGRGGPGDGLP